MPTPRHIVAVTALVQNEQGKVLLVRHPTRGWEPPGGQVEEGETLWQALEREILEETGVTIGLRRLVGLYSNVAPPPKLIVCFLALYRAGNPRPSPESIDVRWLQPEVALEMITHPAIRARFADMLGFTGRVIYQVYTTEPYQLIARNYV